MYILSNPYLTVKNDIIANNGIAADTYLSRNQTPLADGNVVPNLHLATQSIAASCLYETRSITVCFAKPTVPLRPELAPLYFGPLSSRGLYPLATDFFELPRVNTPEDELPRFSV